MRGRDASLGTAIALLLVYLSTLAPGVTFWDAGEFIAAAHGLGIPHPPGTPLYVALGRAWIVALGPLVGSARAMNVLSACCTAGACGLFTATIARETRDVPRSAWGAAAGGLLAGTMLTVWANATETEVYALSLLHVCLLLACAARAGRDADDWRWLALTAYVMSLAPAIHLSALVGAPAAIALAAHPRNRGWSARRLLFLGGTAIATAGIGRVSTLLVVAGTACQACGLVVMRPRLTRTERGRAAMALLLVPLAATGVGLLLVRARLDPALNQGGAATLSALLDVVGRRQYPVAGLLPRQAPVWLQVANVFQYLDWQVAMGWGRGIFTTPARAAATLAYVPLAVAGWRDVRRCSPRLGTALLVLAASGSFGVAAYLNLKAGASLGWGVVADTLPHEARERDYFFVLAFLGWAAFAGWGAWVLATRAAFPAAALGVAVIPLLANWRVVDRSREPEASAAHAFASDLLAASPPGAVLFTGGDNDSYPLWYLQQVEGVRTDVVVVTMPLLPADWYAREIGRRTGWRWDARVPVTGARWAHDLTAAGIARAAAANGRTVAASPALTARERSLLGGRWSLGGPVYVARDARPDAALPALDTGAARAWMVGHRHAVRPVHDGTRPDDASTTMLALLECPRLALPWAEGRAARDSLEVTCNFR